MYKEALKTAGAEVHCFKEFGSYQGDWWAKVTYNGKTGWVTGSYGSCSGCDAFHAEFGWYYKENPDFKIKLAEFGSRYLGDIMSQEDAVKIASQHIDWDCESDEMVKYIKDNA